MLISPRGRRGASTASRWRSCPAPTARRLLVSLDGGARRARWTWSSRSCTARTARTARCRGRWRRPGCPTSGAGVAASARRDGQGPLQGLPRARGHPHARALRRHARPSGRADPGGRARAGGRARSATRPSASRRASGRASASAPCPTPAALDAALELAFAHDPKALVERAIAGPRGRGGGARRRRARSPPRWARSPSTATGTTTRPSTSRAARGLQVPADLPGGGRRARPRRWPCAPSPPSTAPASRAIDFFVDRGRRGAALRAQHDARLHADERLRRA